MYCGRVQQAVVGSGATSHFTFLKKQSFWAVIKFYEALSMRKSYTRCFTDGIGNISNKRQQAIIKGDVGTKPTFFGIGYR